MRETVYTVTCPATTESIVPTTDGRAIAERRSTAIGTSARRALAPTPSGGDESLIS